MFDYDRRINEKYGIAYGTGNLIFIKTGKGGSIEGYQGKYLRLTEFIHEEFNCSVVVSANPVDEKCNLPEEMDFILKEIGPVDEVYYIGISDGALVGAQQGYKVPLIMDASAKDLTNYYNIINNVLKPEFGNNAKKRILIALNQSDIAMKGAHWDAEKNSPDKVLEDFLKKKAASVQERIRENTGLNIKPVCYCAGYSEDGIQRKPYNLTKLLYFIVKAAPKAKRFNIAENINQDEDNWFANDDELDYSEELEKAFGEVILDCISDGIDTGAELGEDILGIPGFILGGVLGGVIGGIGGFFKALES